MTLVTIWYLVLQLREWIWIREIEFIQADVPGDQNVVFTSLMLYMKAKDIIRLSGLSVRIHWWKRCISQTIYICSKVSWGQSHSRVYPNSLCKLLRSLSELVVKVRFLLFGFCGKKQIIINFLGKANIVKIYNFVAFWKPVYLNCTFIYQD